MGAFTVLGLSLGSLLRTYFFMITTSYLGSFLVFRGFGNLFGNYPNLFSLNNHVKLNNSYYMYFGLIMSHMMLGFLSQTILNKRFNDGEDDRNYKEDAKAVKEEKEVPLYTENTSDCIESNKTHTHNTNTLPFKRNLADEDVVDVVFIDGDVKESDQNQYKGYCIGDKTMNCEIEIEIEEDDD